MTTASCPAADEDCVIGLDVGGTSTRALAVDLAGDRLAESRTGGGNPASRGIETAVRNVAEALAKVLAVVPVERVRSVVMGIAGIATLKNDDGEPIFDPVWRNAGLSGRVRMTADATVAFTAGTPRPNGTVLIAGTGAIATAIVDHDLAGRRSDGYGWLLGDLGSGFWLGREAVSATLRHIDGIGPGGRLIEAVLDAMLPAGADPTVNQVITHAMATEPVALSAYAPLVTRAADDGDPLACDLVDAAAGHLMRSVEMIHIDDRHPIVLAGSLAAGDTAVSRRLRARLAADHPDAEIRVATDGAAGAAWLAATDVTGDTDRLRSLHQRLMPSTG